jgi:hypothetical protein
MGFLSRSQPDGSWVIELRPIVENISNITTALDTAVDVSSPDQELAACTRAAGELPILAESLKEVRRPKSRSAREADKLLRKTVSIYIDAGEVGMAYYQRLAGASSGLLAYGVEQEEVGLKDDEKFQALVATGRQNMWRFSTVFGPVR